MFSVFCRKLPTFTEIILQSPKDIFFLNAIGERCSEFELSSPVEDSLPLEKRKKKKNKHHTTKSSFSIPV